MDITLDLVDIGILLLGLAALVGVAFAFWLPHRFRPADITAPSDREAFRGNLIQTLTLVLVVLGAAVALKQLGASIEQLQDERIDRLAESVEVAEQSLLNAEGTEQARRDAIADLASLHAKSPEHRVQIERRLLRFVQDRARVTDVSAYAAVGTPTADVGSALRFLLNEGQAQLEEDWRFADGGATLVLSNLDLRGIQLPGANLASADLRGTYLRGADLRNAQMRGANLAGADLAGANLQGSVLRGSTLADANLAETRLTGADLAEADLRGAAGLTWEQVRDAAIACSTQLPTVLPSIGRDEPTPMLLVLRDCLRPGELRIGADRPTLVLFGTTLPAPVVVRIDALGVAVEVHNQTQAEARLLDAAEGTYRINASVAEGAPPLSSALLAGTDPSVALAPDATAAPTGAAITTPTAVVVGSGEQTPIATEVAADARVPASSGGTYSEPPPDDAWFPDFSSDEEYLAWLETLPEAGADATPVVRTASVDPAAEVGDLDCVQFPTQEAAQGAFEQAGGPHVDLYGLDGDGNGIACEVVP